MRWYECNTTIPGSWNVDDVRSVTQPVATPTTTQRVTSLSTTTSNGPGYFPNHCYQLQICIRETVS